MKVRGTKSIAVVSEGAVSYILISTVPPQKNLVKTSERQY